MSTGQPSWLVFAPGIFVVMWSTGYVAAKFGLGYIEPMTFLALRFACVVAIMAVLFVILRPPLPKTHAEWLHLAIVGLLLQAMYFGMAYMSFNAGLSVGTLALILAMQPIIVGLVAPRWSGETVGWQRWAGLVLGLTGAVIVIAARSEIAAPSAIGFLFASLALFGITGVPCGRSALASPITRSHRIWSDLPPGCWAWPPLWSPWKPWKLFGRGSFSGPWPTWWSPAH